MKRALTHGGNIYRGVADMLRLRPSWCQHIGNTQLAFFLALMVNVLAVPVGAWFALEAGVQAGVLTFHDHLFIEGLMLAIMVVLLFVLTLCRLRTQKFPVVYAGVTYSGVVIAAVLALVQLVMGFYGQSLYGQNVPMLAHSLLVGALVWMVILTSFVFKTALQVGVAASVVMTAVVFFVLITGRQVLEMMWMHYT